MLLEIYHLLTASTDILVLQSNPLLRWHMKLCYLKTWSSIIYLSIYFSCECLILSQISFQFLASSATSALAQIRPVQRMNWKKTAAKNQPVYPEWTDAWGSGAKKVMPQPWSAPVAMSYCAKLPRIPNATWINVLWIAVTLTCVTLAIV